MWRLVLLRVERHRRSLLPLLLRLRLLLRLLLLRLLRRLLLRLRCWAP